MSQTPAEDVYAGDGPQAVARRLELKAPYGFRFTHPATWAVAHPMDWTSSLTTLVILCGFSAMTAHQLQVGLGVPVAVLLWCAWIVPRVRGKSYAESDWRYTDTSGMVLMIGSQCWLWPQPQPVQAMSPTTLALLDVVVWCLIGAALWLLRQWMSAGMTRMVARLVLLPAALGVFLSGLQQLNAHELRIAACPGGSVMRTRLGGHICVCPPETQGTALLPECIGGPWDLDQSLWPSGLPVQLAMVVCGLRLMRPLQHVPVRVPLAYSAFCLVLACAPWHVAAPLLLLAAAYASVAEMTRGLAQHWTVSDARAISYAAVCALCLSAGAALALPAPIATEKKDGDRDKRD